MAIASLPKMKATGYPAIGRKTTQFSPVSTLRGARATHTVMPGPDFRFRRHTRRYAWCCPAVGQVTVSAVNLDAVEAGTQRPLGTGAKLFDDAGDLILRKCARH